MSEPTARVVLVALSLPQLAVAAWAAFAPHSFFREIADFGAYNGHLVEDYATFSAAIGAALLGSARWPSWRRGALVAAAIWSSLHVVNHVFGYSAARTPAIALTSLLLLVASAAAYVAAAIVVPTRPQA